MKEKLQTVVKQIQEHHPILFYHFVKYAILLNLFTSIVGGMLWAILWGAANDTKYAYDLYWTIQPLSELPKWMATAISYCFTIVIVLNLILFCLFVIGLVMNDKQKKKNEL